MRGYWINKAFGTLADPSARQRWRDDRAAYLDDFKLSPQEREWILNDDWVSCLDAGASICTLTKVGATTGESLLAMGAQMRGETREEFRAFIDAQNRRNEGYTIPFTVKERTNG